MKTSIVLIGSGEFGIPTFRTLAHHPNFNVRCVITQPPSQTKSGTRATPVAIWAVTEKLPCVTLTSLRDPISVKQLANFSDAVWLVIDYGLIIPKDILTIPKWGVLNVHGSMLPKYRGAAPIAAALIAGDTSTGITVMKLDAGIDTGPILNQKTLPIFQAETAPELKARLADVAAEITPDTILEYLAGQRQPIPQPQTHARYVPRLTKNDGRANWESGILVERKIRAYQPWPGVWTEWRGKRLKLLSATFKPEMSQAPVGTVLPQSHGRWAIACADGVLLPAKIQFEGKRPQPAESVPGSYPDFVGSQLA